MSDITVCRLHPEAISEDIWNRVSGYIEPALEVGGGRYDLPHLWIEIFHGRQQLWIIFRGADDLVGFMTTMISNYPLKSYVNVTFAGGDGFLKCMKEVHEGLVDFALEYNCNGLEIVGRKGWERVMKPFGFEIKEHSFMTEEF